MYRQVMPGQHCINLTMRFVTAKVQYLSSMYEIRLGSVYNTVFITNVPSVALCFHVKKIAVISPFLWPFIGANC